MTLRFKSLIASAIVFALPAMAQAQGFELFTGEGSGATDFRVYIQNFYRFSISAAILIATVLIMIGGIMWVTSAGNPGRIEKAKEYIYDSIIGVVLLISAYTILQVINPNLVNLKLPNLETRFVIGACIVPHTSSSTGQVVTTGTGQKCYNGTEGQCEVLKGVFFEKDTCAKLCQSVNADGECTRQTTPTPVTPATPGAPSTPANNCHTDRQNVETTAGSFDKTNCEEHCKSFPNCAYGSHASVGALGGLFSGLVSCACVSTAPAVVAAPQVLACEKTEWSNINFTTPQAATEACRDFRCTNPCKAALTSSGNNTYTCQCAASAATLAQPPANDKKSICERRGENTVGKLIPEDPSVLFGVGDNDLCENHCSANNTDDSCTMLRVVDNDEGTGGNLIRCWCEYTGD